MADGIKIGNLDISAFKVGSSDCKVYLGDVKVYPPAPAPSHDYVEIGGLKWATMNIGASSVTDYGLYFQWGDISGYTSSQVGTDKAFNWEDYKYGNGTSSPGATGMTKYNSSDGKTVLDASDDAAVAIWGGQWRIPALADFQVLSASVNTAWTQVDGVYGLQCTDKTDSSKVLFFPAAGCCDNGSVSNANLIGFYWGDFINGMSVTSAYHLYFRNGSTVWRNPYPRSYGFSVRPVAD